MKGKGGKEKKRSEVDQRRSTGTLNEKMIGWERRKMEGS